MLPVTLPGQAIPGPIRCGSLQLQFESLKATIGQGLINVFTPVITVINAILEKLQTLANYFKAFTEAIFGDASGNAGGVSGSMDSAAGSSGQIADNMGSAAGSAKELNLELAKFDELNNLSSNRGSGGGGVGGGGGILEDLDLGMENVQAQADLISSKIIDAFKAGDYYSVGAYIGAAITDSLRSVNWNEAYESARGFGSGFARFLNGLISPELFGEVGVAIASALNTAIYLALAFGSDFDWTNLGLSIASSINEFFRTFDFASFAESINVWVFGLWETLDTALENVDWSQVIAGMLEFLGNLEIETVGIIIGVLLIKKILKVAFGFNLTSFLVKLLKEKLKKVTLEDIQLKINAISLGIKEILLTEIKRISLVGGWGPAVDVLGKEIIDAIDTFIRENFGQSVLNAMGEGLLIAEGAGIGAFLGGPIGALVGAIVALVIDTVQGGEWVTKLLERDRRYSL